MVEIGPNLLEALTILLPVIGIVSVIYIIAKI